jgi:hypothetical protein
MKNKRLSIKDLAIKYELNERNVYRWVKSGKLDYETNEYGVIEIPENKKNKEFIKGKL